MASLSSFFQLLSSRKPSLACKSPLDWLADRSQAGVRLVAYCMQLASAAPRWSPVEPHPQGRLDERFEQDFPGPTGKYTLGCFRCASPESDFATLLNLVLGTALCAIAVGAVARNGSHRVGW